MPCCIPARDSARCPCVPRELTIKARARLPVAHPLAHHTTRQPHAHGGSSPAPYQGKQAPTGWVRRPRVRVVTNFSLPYALCELSGRHSSILLTAKTVYPRKAHNPCIVAPGLLWMENTLPVKCSKRGGAASVSLTPAACRPVRPPPLCIGGERVPLDRLLSVVAAHAECLRHWQSFFHQPSQPFRFANHPSEPPWRSGHPSASVSGVSDEQT